MLLYKTGSEIEKIEARTKKNKKMKTLHFDSLISAINFLTQEGYTEDFKAEADCIKALYSKKEYQPKELKIVHSFRFEESNSNPDDESELFALVAVDGLKGTLVMSYGAEHSQNVDLIRQLKNK